ncbi:hypothetical protein ACFX12_013379 [Malus domestica]
MSQRTLQYWAKYKKPQPPQLSPVGGIHQVPCVRLRHIHGINTCHDTRTVSVHLGRSESKLIFVNYELQSLICEAISPSPRLVLITNDSSAPSRTTPLDHFLWTYNDLVDKGDEGFESVLPSNK